MVDHEFAIVGAGFGGIGIGIELKRNGIQDFVILEQADDVGGTWRANTYPGLEVDVPSFTYSYGFELNPNWSQLYAPGRELKDYATRCTDKHQLRPHMRFGCRVEQAVFDADRSCWTVHLQSGEVFTARYLVSACGYLSGPRMPDIEGIDEFAGKIMHTAGWDHDHDLTGKKVAIIGTGATAIQLAPAIADRVESLDIYQRTPIWLAPKYNPTFSAGAQRVMRRLPLVMKLIRGTSWAFTDLFFRFTFGDYRRFGAVTRLIERRLVAAMRKQVHDPATQEKLIPRYSFFCKRPSFSSTFYPLFNRDDVELVTDPISHIDEKGLVTRDGTARHVDVIVCATGFRVFQRSSAPMFEMIGEGGKNLGEWWDTHRYQAYLGTTVPDFPNFFMIFGPYAAAGASYFDVLSNQAAHLSRLLRAARKKGANYIAISPEAHNRDFQRVRSAAEKTVLVAGNCATSHSYYLDDRGDSPAAPRPGSIFEFWRRSRTFRLGDYRFENRSVDAGRPAIAGQGNLEVP